MCSPVKEKCLSAQLLLPAALSGFYPELLLQPITFQRNTFWKPNKYIMKFRQIQPIAIQTNTFWNEKYILQFGKIFLYGSKNVPTTNIAVFASAATHHKGPLPITTLKKNKREFSDLGATLHKWLPTSIEPKTRLAPKPNKHKCQKLTLNWTTSCGADNVLKTWPRHFLAFCGQYVQFNRNLSV